MLELSRRVELYTLVRECGSVAVYTVWHYGSVVVETVHKSMVLSFIYFMWPLHAILYILDVENDGAKPCPRFTGASGL